jgi:hypothetical protein
MHYIVREIYKCIIWYVNALLRIIRWLRNALICVVLGPTVRLRSTTSYILATRAEGGFTPQIFTISRISRYFSHVTPAHLANHGYQHGTVQFVNNGRQTMWNRFGLALDRA